MHLLFVCTGNTCRSPLAEGIARQLIATRGVVDVTVGSAGVNAVDGAPASDGSLLVGMEHGLDLSAHRSRALTTELVESADLVLAMGHSHLAGIAELGGASRAYLLTDYATRGRDAVGVSDPFGGALDVYRDTYVELHELVEQVIDRVRDGQEPTAR